MALWRYGAPPCEDQREKTVAGDDWSGRRKRTLTKFVLVFPLKSERRFHVPSMDISQ